VTYYVVGGEEGRGGECSRSDFVVHTSSLRSRIQCRYSSPARELLCSALSRVALWCTHCLLAESGHHVACGGAEGRQRARLVHCQA